MFISNRMYNMLRVQKTAVSTTSGMIEVKGLTETIAQTADTYEVTISQPANTILRNLIFFQVPNPGESATGITPPVLGGRVNYSLGIASDRYPGGSGNIVSCTGGESVIVNDNTVWNLYAPLYVIQDSHGHDNNWTAKILGGPTGSSQINIIASPASESARDLFVVIGVVGTLQAIPNSKIRIIAQFMHI